jgi:hypothetical protein
VDKGGNHGYFAGKGWNPVTGLGWVDGQEMLDAMKGNQTIKVGNIMPFMPIFGGGQNDQPSLSDKALVPQSTEPPPSTEQPPSTF